jgi:tRNA-specific 2-thiouridylase
VELLRGLDPSKDQSYFLHRLTQTQLDRVLFPVGELHKSEVRRIAQEIGLPNAKKKDSTGICFIGERPFREFLNRYLAHKPGPICTPEGLTIGRHQGLSFYTLGQRKGLGIGGIRRKGFVSAEGSGWFVARKDMDRNILYVVQDHDHPWLMSTACKTLDACWVSGQPPGEDDGPFGVKTRYRQADAEGHLGGGLNVPRFASGFQITFLQPQWAVTPGQSAVVYAGEVCLGGGIIDSAINLTTGIVTTPA